MIKILIADDHAIVREGLRRIIKDTTDMIVADFFFSKAIDFDKFIEALKSLIPLYGKSENSHH